MNISIVLDLEGVLTPPGTDFAKSLAERCGSAALRLVQTFDTYDDYRWIKERLSRGGRYQTGTTPFFSLLVAYAHGLSTEDVAELAKETAELVVHEEFIRLARDLSKMFGIVVTTSSYYVFANNVASLLGLNLENVFSTCNTKIDGTYEENVLRTLESIASRSEVAGIVYRICEIAKNVVQDKLPLNSVDTFIEKIGNRDLREYLKLRMIEQVGIAGSKFKARIVKLLKENSNVIYIGDSIVDSEACTEANASISVNTTSPHLLYSSTVNVVTEDYTSIVDVVDILLSLLRVKRGRIQKDRCRRFLLFFSSDVVKNFSLVLDINRKVREKVRDRYCSAVRRPRLPRDLFIFENL
ncbi:MAG: hypothetical protein GXO23_06190 [Crenarchaeota archaeon]|nr:hypothetical protein [Thermoproteota archaeon]